MYPVPKNPRISIIIPTLNEEKLITLTLRNARKVVPEAEIIVVDGGSRDNTVKIARKYTKVYVRHGSVGFARNTGAKMSKGDILVFLDADTTITRQFIDEALKALSDPNVVGVGGLIMPHNVNQFEGIVFYFLNLLIMISFVIRRPNLAGTCVAYKRKPFLEVGGFDTNMVASEDFDLCKRISKKGKVAFLKHVIVRTSRRRLKNLGLLGLIVDWSKVTVQYLLGVRSRMYHAFR
jgi:cellulose synthase/poly-beta-1,6-N-acetylglucosamine synthase-like glycosyltransferase